MSVLFNGAISSSSSVDTGDIGHSLRFRASAGAYLNRTFSTPTSQNSWALSFWVKQAGSIGTATAGSVFARKQDTQNFEAYGFDVNASSDTNKLSSFTRTTSGVNSRRASGDALYRDPTTWQHCVILKTASQSSSAPAFYVNGVAVTITTRSSAGTPQDFINAAAAHVIGQDAQSASTSDFYLARVCFVDNGGALTPSSFGYFNTEINEWVSKSQSAVKTVVDAGGTNSFMLDFDDATSLTTLGYDKSSKGNNWTLNNFSLTAGTTYDHMLDVPGNSYATLNPIYPAAANITNGNLSSGTTAARATMNSTAFDSQWFVTAGGSAVTAGVIDDAGTTSTTSVTANKVFAFKMTAAGALSYKNVTDAGSWTSIATGLTGNRWPYSVTQAASWNFGQQPFPEALDTGFKALCQANLPAPTILNPEQHHNVYTVTKSGNTNFTLDWDGSVYDTYFEIKRRDAAGTWYNVDGLRGYDKILHSETTAAETTDANVIGVSGTTCTLKSTLPDGTYVISAWKAGLTASRQTNTDGSITSTVSRNVTSGFAIVTYTGTGANATVGHGLGAVPKMVIARNRSTIYDCPVYHSSQNTTPQNGSMYLNLTNAYAANASYWNNTAPTSTTISLGSGVQVNAAAANQVLYVHAEIPGYSKFGSYTGNAAADNAYVDVGFKAKWLRTKSSTTADDWRVYDSLRPGYNVQGGTLLANTTALESTTAEVDIDSSGFKVRIATTPGAAQTYVYSAYADVTNKYSAAR